MYINTGTVLKTMKKSVKKILATALSLLSVSALTGATACAVKSMELEVPVNTEITKIDPPTDGSLPTAHSGVENLAYIAKAFEEQPQYHMYSYTITSAAIATQFTRSYRDYKDGVLITSDITYSSLVKSGVQTCTVFNEDKGEYEMYQRASGEPSSDTVSTTASWEETAPIYFSKAAFYRTYGLLQTELTGLILNEDSVIESGEVHANPDGTFTQSFVLDPVVSTYYYSFGMKTRGGLSGYPSFQSVDLTVTFTDKWLPLGLSMHDVSTVNKGVVVSSVSETTCDISYDNLDTKHLSYYDSYFKQYLGEDDLEQGGEVDETFVLDVTNVLSNGFSKIMDGGAQFEIELDLNKNKYRGFIFVALDLADPLETLELKLSLGKTLEEQGLFVEYKNGEANAYYGNDFALEVNIAELKPQIDEIVSWAEELAKSFNDISQSGGEGGGLSLSDEALSDLMNSMTLEDHGGEAILSLVTDDLLGLGVGIDVQLFFGIDTKTATFRGGVIKGISVGGEALDINLVLRSTTAEIISRDASQTGAKLSDFVADAFALISSDLIKVEIELSGDSENVNVSALKGVNANVTAYVDIDGVTVGAEAAVSYNLNGNKLSAIVDIYYDYNPQSSGYGRAVLTLKEINGVEYFVQVGCDVEELVDAISSLLTFGGAPSGVATDSVVGMINSALSNDLSSLLGEVYADSLRIKLGVNVDAALTLLGVDAGVKFGSCTLVYERGEGAYGGTLSAALPAIGFCLKVSGAEGAITPPDTSNCLDLCYVIEDVKELLSADLYAINLTFDGNAIDKVKGLEAEATVYADIEGLALYAQFAVSYTYDDKTVSAKLSAWYEYDSATNGTVVLSLDEINGVQTGAKVSAEIAGTVEAVKQLLAYCNVQLSPSGNSVDVELDEVLSSLLSADLSVILPELGTSAGGAKLAVNVDEVLRLLNVELPVSFGNVTLAYSHADCNITAQIPAVGVALTVSGVNGEIAAAPQENVLDLAKLVQLVNGAIEQVNAIKDSQSLAFEIMRGTTYLYLDGITVNVWGKGEISWKEGGEYVALDLGFSIAENGLDVMGVKLLYDKNAVTSPLVRIAINEVGLDIYSEDLEATAQTFESIYEKIASAFGLSGGISLPNLEIGGELDASPLTSNDKLLAIAFGVLASGDWVNALNDMTLSIDGADGEKHSLTLTYAADNAAEVRVSTDGGIALFYDVTCANGFAFGGEIEAGAVRSSLVGKLNGAFDSLDMVSTKKDGSASFIRLAYDYLFDAIGNITVTDILGSDTYTVAFNLTGDNCNIEALKGVFVNAEIYVTGEAADRGRLAEGDLNIDVNGIAISLNVITERRSGETYFYIDMRQVAHIKLPDLKVVATQSSFYETVATLVSVVNDTNVLQFISKLIPSGEGSDEDQPIEINGALPEITDETASGVANILEKIINFNFSEAVIASRVGDEMTAMIDLDNVASQFGAESDPLGTIEIYINHKTHAMKTSGMAPVTDSFGVVELKEWISLASYKAEARDYSKLDKSQYVDIRFIPDLLNDAIKFATDDNGDIYEMFTLSGTVSVNLVSLIEIELDIATLTLGFGEDTGFYFSLIANLKGGMVSNNTIGLTYQNGYLTLGKNLSTNKPEYKIMTFEYFVDNMFANGSASTLNWLLGVNNTLWSMAMGLMGDLVKMDSGLTTPQDIYLYKATEILSEEEISMYDYVNALRVIINGSTSADFGDISELESKLGVYDNYYGFDLNASIFTDGVLTKLCAAITRSDAAGITGVRAYGAIQSYVKFSASLEYKEGLTADNYFKVGETLTAGVTAPSLYNEAVAKAEQAGVAIDFDHYVKMPEKGYDELFGCFSTSNMSHAYSRVLYSHLLTVVHLDGTVEECNVRHGSTIYLYDNSFPVYSDDGKTQRIVYSLEEGGDVYGKTIIAASDITLYQITRKAVNVVIINGANELIITSFAGDSVPTKVDGLDTIEGPYYENGTPVAAGDIIPEDVALIRLYGTFVQSEVIVNYVKYTFDAATHSYIVSGKAAGFADKYSVQGETLVLENEINGYPVTAIADGAFYNTDDKPIKNVIVAPNITRIGKNAFSDNKEMESVIFLADNVYFEGSDGDNTYAFYGCCTTDDSEKTNLVIYYNYSDCKDHNLTWTHFSTKSVFGLTYYKYVGTDPNTSESINYHANGGGALHGAGTWSMLDVEVTGAELVEDTDFTQLVNERVTAGFITGRVYSQTDADALASELTAILSVYRNDLGNDKYVVQVTVKENGVCMRTLIVSVALNQPKPINVYSAVAMNYAVGSMDQAVQANTVSTVYAVTEGEYVTLFAPRASGYTFLGWAVSVNGGLQFVAEKVVYDESTVYYAIWGTSKVGQEVRSDINYSGSALIAPSCGDGRWYDNEWNEVTAVSKENMVVYTRTIFTLTVELSGKIFARNVLHVGNDSSKTAMSSGTSLTMQIYEGKATFTLIDKVLYVDDGVNVTAIYVNEVKSNGNEDTNSKRGIKSSISGTVEVNSDFSVTVSY